MRTSSSADDLAIGSRPVKWFSRVGLAVLFDAAIDAGIQDGVSYHGLGECFVGVFHVVSLAVALPLPATFTVAVADTGRRRIVTPNRWWSFRSTRLGQGGRGDEQQSECQQVFHGQEYPPKP